MAHISVADDLLQQVQAVGSADVSDEQFVEDAVREKLEWQQRKAEFCQLSDETRQLMTSQGLTETELLTDFEASRNGPGSD